MNSFDNMMDYGYESEKGSSCDYPRKNDCDRPQHGCGHDRDYDDDRGCGKDREEKECGCHKREEKCECACFCSPKIEYECYYKKICRRKFREPEMKRSCGSPCGCRCGGSGCGGCGCGRN